MKDSGPIIVWLRSDLRLADNPALAAAARTGRPVLPVFIRDTAIDALGAAPAWRLGQGLRVFAGSLAQLGSRLILRSGPAQEVLSQLVAETGAVAVHWNRLYQPETRTRDAAIKTALTGQGVEVQSHTGNLAFEPWTVATKAGGPFRVFSPMWRSVRSRSVALPDAPPRQLLAPDDWPHSEALDDWGLERAMQRGGAVVGAHAAIGEVAAQEALATFIADRLAAYGAARDNFSGRPTSGLSPFLAVGEIGVRQCWHAAHRALQDGNSGAEIFLKELVWREFAYHLMFHNPEILYRNWRSTWDGFPWNADAQRPDVVAWKQGRTGVPLVDAAMREMYVTGTMHNRGRMIVGSYLTKHLLTDWRIGQHWFEQHLIDWDPASNAMGWQWVAGSGPDASPYFRIFNPETQAIKFDPDSSYRRAWIAEGQGDPPATALSYFAAIPRSWGMTSDAPPARPAATLSEGRGRALTAYQDHRAVGSDDSSTSVSP